MRSNSPGQGRRGPAPLLLHRGATLIGQRAIALPAVPWQSLEMKIVLAFDSFKGSLAAEVACRIAAEAIVAACPEAEVVEKPMADGGEGTAAAIVAASKGEWIPWPATGPLPSMIVDAGFGWLASSRTAIVEMAAASGLTLLRPDQRNPFQTTTLGTGELIRAVADYGARHILLAVGGSATVDGGIGAAHALGWRFLNRSGHEIAPNGGGLGEIVSIRPPDHHAEFPKITVLADVTNPLCGESGAARIFGPQKGATAEQAMLLDAGLLNLGKLIQRDLGIDVLSLPGAGAAGGLAAGAVAFMGATITSGVGEVMRIIGLDEAIKDADWALTGEGCLDAQSLQGKVISGILQLAHRHGAHVAALAGRIALTNIEIQTAGITFADAVTTEKLMFDEARRNAPELLEMAVNRFIRACIKR